MPDHYYTNQPNSEHAEKEIKFDYRGNTLCFVTDAGTFSRGRVDPGSALLLSSIGDVSGRCADIGCGWGAIGLSLALANPKSEWLLIDINERSAELARRNAELNGVRNADIRVNDGLASIEGPFAHIVTNPPIRAGKETVYGFFDQALERLTPGGFLTVVIRKQQGAASAKTYLQEIFGNCETAARGGGYHILRSIKDL